MPGHYEVYQDVKGKYRFRLVASNGQTIASSEAYNDKDSCMDGIKSVKANANAPVREALIVHH